MTKQLRFFLLFAALMGGLGQFAQASTIETGTLTLTNCGTNGSGCPAATYTFSVGTTSATLTIQISNTAVLNSANDLIGGVNLGFATSSNMNITDLTTSANLGGKNNWEFSTGSLSSNGCGGNNGAFVCADFTANPTNGGVLLTQNGVYSWTWTYDAITAADVFPVAQIHIGANYNLQNGLIVSQTGAVATPEPSTLVTLGGSLLGLAAVLRRKYPI